MQDRKDKPPVRQGPDLSLDSEAAGPSRFPALDFLGDPGSLPAEIDRLKVQLSKRDARKAQQGVNLPPHLLTAGDDSLRIAMAFIAKSLPIILK